MKNANFEVGSRIRVVNPDSPYYRFRGSVSEDVVFSDGGHLKWKCRLSRGLDGRACKAEAEFSDSEITNIQKKFIDIEHIKETDVLVGKDPDGNDIVRKSNTGAFEPGDTIQVTEKIDGANASVSYNAEDGRLEAFSRTNLLDGADGLRGFKQYVDLKLSPEAFARHPEYVVFGEWTVSHKVQYSKENWKTWKVYDIWNKLERNYMPQPAVKAFCAENGLEYVHVLYEGPFVSWDHCRSFLHSNTYGGSQEGIVVKNQSKLSDSEMRFPKYLKIVNEEFRESTKAKEKKQVDPEKQEEFERSKALVESVVTEARVSKIVLKMVDKGVLPAELSPKCMGTAMKNVPKAVWEDLLKEEPETLAAVGDNASRLVNSATAALLRKLMIGK